MSNLARSAMQARMSKLPQLSPEPVDEEDEEIGPLPAYRSVNTHRAPAFTPLPATPYFSHALQIAVPASHLDMRAYYTPPNPRTKDEPGSVLVCHHGAGFSGLSFALFAAEVAKASSGELGVFSLDARRHGKTVPTDGASDEDLSLDVLVQDIANLIPTAFPDPKTAPTFFLVGHSMGGAVVVRACPLLQDLKYRIGGVAVLDVVEGSALEALPLMPMILSSRPSGFDSIEQAVEWHLTANQIRNPTSARVSVPSLIVPAPSDPSSLRSHPFTWRTPLGTTGPYWETWFRSLSSSFLSARTARLLILAGTDRLDKELMIAQMQGKFQMQVVPGTGHMLHEDDPSRLAEILVEFWRRNDRVVIGVKKVGEL